MTSNIFSLDNKIAVVTGASRGIGKSISLLLAEYGAHVIVSSRKLDDCNKVVEEIKKNGGSAESFTCHIGEPDQIEAIYKHIDEQHGRIDILVNNGVANPYYGPTIDIDLAAYEKIMSVNVRGYFFMSVNAAKRMRNHDGGSIINIASINAVRPAKWQGVYSMSKAAIVNMTQSLAKELGENNIRVNAILPGFTETKFASALHDDKALRDKFLKHVPLGRMAQPEEIAPAVLYLAADAGKYATGSCITVDGGLLWATGP